MKIVKRSNGVWSFVDEFYTNGLEIYPFGCIIDTTTNTFIITSNNRPSYPKEPLSVTEIKVIVEPSTTEETFTTAVGLRNRLLELDFPPLVQGMPSGGIEEAPIDGILYGRKDAGWDAINTLEQSLQDVTDNGNTTTNSIVSSSGLYIDETNGIGINGAGYATFVDRILLFKSISDLTKLGQFKATFKTKADTYQLPDRSGFLALADELLHQYIIVPNLDAITFNSIGKAPVISGSNITRTWANTNYFTKQNRIGFASTALAGTTNYLRQIGGYFSTGDNFYYSTLFGASTGFNLSGVRAFVGVTYSNNTTGNVEQDTMINSIGICRLSTSNKWWLMHNDSSGVATKLDTGFSANTVDTNWFMLELINVIGTGLICNITKMPTGDTYQTVVTSDIPISSVPLTQRVFVTNNANASQVVLDWGGSTLNNI